MPLLFRRAALSSFFLGVLGVAGCGAPFPHPGSAEVQVLAPSDAAVTVDALERGRSLYLAKCGACHMLYEPKAFSAAAWPNNVARMRNEKRVHLSDDDATDIVRYLRAASLVARGD
jgi:mono/diheme cytochrome c family protein